MSERAVPIPVKKAPGRSAVYHDIAAGETLSAIAKEHGTTVEALLAANPEITDPNLIKAGQAVVIPAQTKQVGLPLPKFKHLSPDNPVLAFLFDTAPISADAFEAFKAKVGPEEAKLLESHLAIYLAYKQKAVQFTGEVAMQPEKKSWQQRHI